MDPITMLALGAAASAAGPLAGGLLGDDGGEELRFATNDPGTNAAQSASLAQILGMLGQPQSLEQTLALGSPFNRTVNRVNQMPIRRKTRKRINTTLDSAMSAVLGAREAGDTRPASQILGDVGNKEQRRLARIVAESGFGNIDAFFDAEMSFREQLPGILAQQRELAEFNRQTSLQAQQVARSALGGADINELKQLELDRLLRDIGVRESQTSALGNAMGFNPAAQREALENQRTDADLIALNRAQSLASGNLSIGQQALGLDPTLIALGLAPQFNQGPNLGTVIPGQAANNALAGGVAQGAGSAGSSLGNLGLLGALGYLGKQGPAVGDGSQMNQTLAMQGLR